MKTFLSWTIENTRIPFIAFQTLYIACMHSCIWHQRAIKQAAPWHNNRRLTGNEMWFVLWKPKVPYCVHERPMLDHTLRQFNPVYAVLLYFFKICFSITSHIKLDVPASFWHWGNWAHIPFVHFWYFPSVQGDTAIIRFDFLLQRLTMPYQTC